VESPKKGEEVKSNNVVPAIGEELQMIKNSAEKPSKSPKQERQG